MNKRKIEIQSLLENLNKSFEFKGFKMFLQVDRNIKFKKLSIFDNPFDDEIDYSEWIINIRAEKNDKMYLAAYVTGFDDENNDKLDNLYLDAINKAFKFLEVY